MSFAVAMQPAVAGSVRRIGEIDGVRGLVMALMALDHARAFLLGYSPSPTDLSATWPALFAVRWVTHIVAPGFLLLAGAAVFLRLQRHSRGAVAGYLLVRGVLLVLLELTIVRFGWIPDLSAGVVLLQVIWAIGCSFILLAGLIWLTPLGVGMLGALLIAFHPVLAGALGGAGMPESWLAVLFTGNATLDWPFGQRAVVLYPIVPWAAVMMFGYGIAAVFLRPVSARVSVFTIAGLAGLGAFAGLRWAGIGDPVPFAAGHDAAAIAMAFMNVHKYPPSPLYCLVTLSLVSLLLALFAARPFWAERTGLVTLGRAALFFYVLHLYVLHAFGLAMAGLVWGFGNLGPPPGHSTPGWPVWAVVLAWAAFMPVLYGPTRWFARLKARRALSLF